MMSKSPRWPETLVNSKTNKSTKKPGGKERATVTAALVSRGSTQASSSKSSSCVVNGRRSSLGSRGPDPDGPGSRAAGALKRSSLSHQGIVCDQGTRASRLSSSRSFSSLHTSSLTAAPFMRGSRSLNRLDQRSTDAVPGSRVQKQQVRERKAVNSDLLSSKTLIRQQKDQCRDNTEKVEMESHSPELQESSSFVNLSAECRHHGNNVKKQSRDGAYTHCAVTSGMKSNWVQSVMKNVKPRLTFDLRGSPPEQTPQQDPEQPDSLLVESQKETEANAGVCAEDGLRIQPERERSSADGSSASLMISISPLSSSIYPPLSPSPPPLRCPPPEDGGASTQMEEAETDSPTTAGMLPNEISDVQNETEQQEKSIKLAYECRSMKDKLPCKQQTGQLLKELEQTQKELCRLQQLNRNLQAELRQEKENHSREWLHPQNELLSNPSEQVLALQQLQKVNHNLRCELEAQKASQEEAREDELRRRIDLLAQQAQLLVTGDATALAQAQIEQERQRFVELELEWERRVASLKSQLNVSEEQRTGTELRLIQLQQELESFHSLQQEADRLQEHLQEVTAQLHSNEEAQAQKEARLQKHLTLLQESQDRERKSLAANLAQAEQYSQDLQEKLDRAEQQVEELSKTQTMGTEKAQAQLQEELACAVSAVQTLQVERDQLDCHCQELQNKISEADGELSRLHNRLKTDEAHCYSLERSYETVCHNSLKTDEAHCYSLERSYETVCEELQLALGKVQEKESEIQNIREDYERLLDKKEQELCEVLLKMEVLGNSLEETELQLNETLKVCTCSSSGLTDNPKERARKTESQQTTFCLAVNTGRPEVVDIGSNNALVKEDSRTHPDSIHTSFQSNVPAEDDPERFVSVIKLLETKLYLTEEKLRDIMQGLEEHQGHITCQNPQLCSQLTQSRATAQHLSLLLHSQAKQSQHFAQETEERYRMLVGRFQFALSVIQSCKDRLRATPINITDIEKRLSSVATCLYQGQRDAEKQRLESRYASKGEDKILNDESLAGAGSNITSESTGTLNNALASGGDGESVGRCLMKELFVVERMASVLQSQNSIEKLSLVTGECDGDKAYSSNCIMSHRLVLESEERIQFGGAESNNSNMFLNQAIGRVCVEAELIHAALKFQHERMTQIKNQEAEYQQKDLSDISSELAPHDEQVQAENNSLEGAVKRKEKKESDFKKIDEVPEWLERLTTRLQQRARCLRQLFQEISAGNGVESSKADDWEKASASKLNQMKEQARLIYLWDRLHLDLEQELEESKVIQDKMRSLCKERDMNLNKKQGALNHVLHQLQEENRKLREKLESAEQKIISIEPGNQRLLEDIKDHHEKRMTKVETEFQEKIKELQWIQEEEMKHLHGCCAKDCWPKEKQTKTCPVAPGATGTTSSTPDQTGMRRQSMTDVGNRKTSGEEGVFAMEEMHKKLAGKLQRKHRMEVAALLTEKEQPLQKVATTTAIAAMRRAHRQELERSRQPQLSKESDDITQLDMEYEKEIQALQKDLELMSFQHNRKCLENSHLKQELEEERRSFTQCQAGNQELKKKQHELCAQNTPKALYSNSQDEPHHDSDNLNGETKYASWSPRKRSSRQTLDDIVTNTNNSACLKKAEKSALTHQIRGVRAKSLKEGLSIQERMKLFESF